MHVLTVAPLASGIPYEELSYFGKDTINAGDLVEITIKRRVCKGLVIDTKDAKEERQSLRHASFGLKKISKVTTKEFLHPKLWKALSFSSSYLIQPIGTIIYDLLSERSFETLIPVTIPVGAKGFEHLLLEQNYENRITRYKTTIRESFSKRKSIVMFFPTITDLEYTRDELAFGINEYVVSLHGGLTDKQYKQAQDNIIHNTHPLLILTTPSILPWIRVDLGLVIIEREHSAYYYTHGETGYDMRFVIEQLARGSSIPLLLGSHMLSLKSHLLYKQREATEIMPLQFRNDNAISVVHMVEASKSVSPYLSRVTLSILHDISLSKKGHYFLYAHRKGMYPTTICYDCGTLYVCPKCDRPYVLHKIANIRTYVCHECENIVQLDDDTTLACKHCGSWRMGTLGIATGGVEEELKRLKIPIFVIDGERTPTRAKARKVYKEWEESSYGVLIGTEMAHNIIRKCDGVIILSLDSLFSLPEYRTDEKILNLVTEMAEKVKISPTGEGSLILQTRLKNTPVLKQLVAPSYKEVYDTLLRERDELLLPPYYTVIKASFDNLPETIKSRMEQELEPYVVEWFEQGRGVTLLFIHIRETEWANNPAVRNRIKRITAGGKALVNPLHFFI